MVIFSKQEFPLSLPQQAFQAKMSFLIFCLAGDTSPEFQSLLQGTRDYNFFFSLRLCALWFILLKAQFLDKTEIF